MNGVVILQLGWSNSLRQSRPSFRCPTRIFPLFRVLQRQLRQRRHQTALTAKRRRRTLPTTCKRQLWTLSTAERRHPTLPTAGRVKLRRRRRWPEITSTPHRKLRWGRWLVQDWSGLVFLYLYLVSWRTNIAKWCQFYFLIKLSLFLTKQILSQAAQLARLTFLKKKHLLEGHV